MLIIGDYDDLPLMENTDEYFYKKGWFNHCENVSELKVFQFKAFWGQIVIKMQHLPPLVCKLKL